MIDLTHGIELIDGTMFSYMEPDASSISIEMLAHVLSQVNRFAGHTPFPYSVAQHAVNVSLIVAKGHEKAALMHDTAEAFTNDLPTPLKIMLPELKEIEVRIEAELARRFDFQFPLSKEVKLADLQMLGIEKHVLKPSSKDWAILQGIRWDHLIQIPNMMPMNPRQAKQAFLNRWEKVK